MLGRGERSFRYHTDYEVMGSGEALGLISTSRNAAENLVTSGLADLTISQRWRAACPTSVLSDHAAPGTG